jgi:gluconolactonase
VFEDATIIELPRGFDIGGGTGAGWGKSCDGPVWLAEHHCLTFTDSGKDRRLTWSASEGLQLLHEGTHQALGTARDLQGRLVSCEWASGRVVRLEADGPATVLADGYRGERFNHPDDVAVDARGSIWFTDVRTSFPVLDPPAVGRSGVYRMAGEAGGDGTGPELLIDDLEEPGGLAFSPDGRTLYVSDSVARRILAYDVEGADRALGPARVLIAFDEPDRRAPYGMTVDGEGNVYAGGPEGICVVAPDGRLVGTIRHPASRTTNLAWGGDEGTTLFVTTSVAVGYVELPAATRRPAAPGGDHATAGGAVSGVSRRHPLVARHGVERLHPDLDRIVPGDVEIVELASGGIFDDLGGGLTDHFARSLEGNVWVPDPGHLLFSDIGNSRILRYDGDGRFSVAFEPTGYTNGSTLDNEGRLVSCEQGARRVSRHERDGSTTIVAERFEGRRLSRPNDVVVRSDGSIYFTAPWWDFGAGEEREVDFNGVFLVSPDLSTVTAVLRDFTIPNGLCFDVDETVLYVNDSLGMHIRAFDVRPDGTLDLDSDRVLIQMPGSHLDGLGSPDGMKVDVEGNVYCGGPGGLWVISPSGQHLGTLVHGATQTNNLCFGGPDGRTLFMATWHSLFSVRLALPGAPVPRRPNGTP